MSEVFQSIGDSLLLAYNALISTLPESFQKFIAFFIIAIGIVIYSIFVWKFYQSIAKKNLIGLNLNKYNKSKHPLITKIFAGGLYLLEYILLLPFIIFIWFTVFTILLIFVTQNLPITTLLIISGTIIAAIRMTSYYNQDLSKDIAKLIPFTLLATSLLNPDFFSITRIFSLLAEIPNLFGEIGIYLFFVIILEIVLRLFDFTFSLFQVEDKPEKEDEED